MHAYIMQRGYYKKKYLHMYAVLHHFAIRLTTFVFS